MAELPSCQTSYPEGDTIEEAPETCPFGIVEDCVSSAARAGPFAWHLFLPYSRLRGPGTKAKHLLGNTTSRALLSLRTQSHWWGPATSPGAATSLARRPPPNS